VSKQEEQYDCHINPALKYSSMGLMESSIEVVIGNTQIVSRVHASIMEWLLVK